MEEARVVGGAKIVSSLRNEDTNEKDLQQHEAPFPTHLILHFDINETILVGDEIGGDRREDCLNKMIAKSAFIQLPPDFINDQEQKEDIPQERYQSIVPTHWWDGTPIQPSSPHDDKTLHPNGNQHDNQSQQQQHIPPLYTGWEWPPGTCPYYRTSLKPNAKEFVDTDGSQYQTLYDILDGQLGDGTTTSTTGAASSPLPRYQEMMKSMIPAFFDTLVELSTRRRQSGDTTTPFTIVIRTFGMDLPDVAKAISDFAQGRHPDYPEFCDPEFVLSNQNLFEGSWAVTATKTARDKSGNEVVPAVYQLLQHGKVVADGDEQVLKLLHSCKICGVQDDYFFWKHNGYQPWAGKPVWALAPPPSSKHDITSHQEVYYHHILLDDNIHNLHDDSVACVRQEELVPPQTKSSSFRTLTGKEIQAQHGVHLIRVPTIEPVLNPHWFLEQIAKAQRQLFHKLQDE